MTIGIDLSPLQGPHRMRGIGYTVLNLINNLPDDIKSKHHFVFYAFPDKYSLVSPFELLDMQGFDYEVRELRPRKRFSYKLPGRLYLLNSVGNQLVELKDLYFGDSRIKTVRGLDVFLQTDQSQSLPHRGRTKKALILYDVIPYVLEWEYLWSYKTARRQYGFSRKAAFRCQVRRWLYAHKLRVNVRRAKVLLSISEQTKSDFVRLLSTPAKKIIVTPLGVSKPGKHFADTPTDLRHYKKTSWGYLEYPLELDSKVPFLLFVGGADKRRKLGDLITAFNNLRAQGHELKLILAGDSMRGPGNISTEEIQTALKDSSYLDDIIFMGFVNDIGRDWLYKNSLAFVFPSRYEGFGLPVLEAMIHDCPVISYENDAVKAVAEQAPLYTYGSRGIFESVKILLESTDGQLEAIRIKGRAQAKKFSWEKTSQYILSNMIDML
ncbi:MAG TPA: glycosyltransferase family 1 protein [Candidatus Saccharimonadales bacterium]|nr:glycosyltransferase family 1 protein [Candidatus Saccharimonadales bacterium]